jgi:dTDP-4-dehydrorhamnose 3,5-epimerase
MNVIQTGIEGLLIFEPKAYSDDRGYFMELYNEEIYKKLGLSDTFVQDNISLSHKGVLRGLHFQMGTSAQGKLVTVLRGAVLDVAIDIRKGSLTFGKMVMVELNAENKKQFFIPAGFAHGFLSLEDNTLFSYKCTKIYNKDSEGGIVWDDTDLAIDWGAGEKIVSDKDKVLQTFAEYKRSQGIQ